MKFAAFSWAAAAALALACDRSVEERSVEGEPEKEVPQRSAPATIPGDAPEVKLVAPLPEGQWTIAAGDYRHTRVGPLAGAASVGAMGAMRYIGNLTAPGSARGRRSRVRSVRCSARGSRRPSRKRRR